MAKIQTLFLFLTISISCFCQKSTLYSIGNQDFFLSNDRILNLDEGFILAGASIVDKSYQPAILKFKNEREIDWNSLVLFPDYNNVISVAEFANSNILMVVYNFELQEDNSKSIFVELDGATGEVVSSKVFKEDYFPSTSNFLIQWNSIMAVFSTYKSGVIHSSLVTIESGLESVSTLDFTSDNYFIENIQFGNTSQELNCTGSYGRYFDFRKDPFTAKLTITENNASFQPNLINILTANYNSLDHNLVSIGDEFMLIGRNSLSSTDESYNFFHLNAELEVISAQSLNLEGERSLEEGSIIYNVEQVSDQLIQAYSRINEIDGPYRDIIIEYNIESNEVNVVSTSNSITHGLIGGLILEENIQQDQHSISYSEFPESGVYLIQILNQSGSMTKKIMVQ